VHELTGCQARELLGARRDRLDRLLRRALLAGIGGPIRVSVTLVIEEASSAPPAAVPEPSGIAQLGVGLVGMALGRVVNSKEESPRFGCDNRVRMATVHQKSVSRGTLADSGAAGFSIRKRSAFEELTNAPPWAA
jgi:hypothetical protein